MATQVTIEMVCNRESRKKGVRAGKEFYIIAANKGILSRVPLYVWWIFLLEGTTAILLYLLLVMTESL
jgi:hypothetical protein